VPVLAVERDVAYLELLGSQSLFDQAAAVVTYAALVLQDILRLTRQSVGNRRIAGGRIVYLRHDFLDLSQLSWPISEPRLFSGPICCGTKEACKCGDILPGQCIIHFVVLQCQAGQHQDKQ
jgi:hypothetical protein